VRGCGELLALLRAARRRGVPVRRLRLAFVRLWLAASRCRWDIIATRASARLRRVAPWVAAWLACRGLFAESSWQVLLAVRSFCARALCAAQRMPPAVLSCVPSWHIVCCMRVRRRACDSCSRSAGGIPSRVGFDAVVVGRAVGYRCSRAGFHAAAALIPPVMYLRSPAVAQCHAHSGPVPCLPWPSAMPCRGPVPCPQWPSAMYLRSPAVALDGQSRALRPVGVAGLQVHRTYCRETALPPFARRLRCTPPLHASAARRRLLVAWYVYLVRRTSPVSRHACEATWARCALHAQVG
jgi:hypothetical protein